MSATLPLPAGARRLFPHYDQPLPAEAAGLVIARLLEDGDRQDLRWLFQHFGHPRLAAWVDRHGARQLSRRSLSFWCTTLGLSSSELPALREDLWCL
jgi:hypothetical protein